ncbi:uncharacterized protein BP5553_04013 [Venustampulla echinocandica]|uniref:Very-long-chain (3R)-3-hydroxyacyl-CoA dehydratase n=1 Tax=Venustampulla echinocandica TaxID=2656787 RepID=A0A370TVW2_9HELO|nr:uncharacterized protein BP5553_04013 [Venustampulla echinocandica]RDL39673.1 hypothetical protein BP5553_04013 [Venustampulla echinocandica]
MRRGDWRRCTKAAGRPWKCTCASPNDLLFLISQLDLRLQFESLTLGEHGAIRGDEQSYKTTQQTRPKPSVLDHVAYSSFSSDPPTRAAFALHIFNSTEACKLATTALVAIGGSTLQRSRILRPRALGQGYPAPPVANIGAVRLITSLPGNYSQNATEISGDISCPSFGECGVSVRFPANTSDIITYSLQVDILSDFQNGCSTQCQSALTAVAKSVISACDGASTSSNILLGVVLTGGIIPALCPTVTTSPTTARSVTSATSRSTKASSSAAQSSSATSKAAVTTSATESSSSPSESSTSSSQSSIDVGGSSSSLITTTSPEGLVATSSSSSKAAEPTKKPNTKSDSGGGSPFDIQASTGHLDRGSTLPSATENILWLKRVAGTSHPSSTPDTETPQSSKMDAQDLQESASPQRKPSPKPLRSSSPKKQYLILYNFTSALLWLVVLGRVVLLVPLVGFGRTYKGVGQFAKWTQTMALLEVVHAATGLVRAPISTTGMQVASRILLTWGVVNSFPSLAKSAVYSCMLVAWSVTEVIRYSYFTITLSGYAPKFITWLRYNTFYVLYPMGISIDTVYLCSWIVYSVYAYDEAEKEGYERQAGAEGRIDRLENATDA